MILLEKYIEKILIKRLKNNFFMIINMLMKWIEILYKIRNLKQNLFVLNVSLDIEIVLNLKKIILFHFQINVLLNKQWQVYLNH